MKNFAVVALLMGAGALPVLADTQFNFTYSDSNYSLQGVLTASPDGGGVYTVTGVTGTVTYVGTDNSVSTSPYALTLVPPGVVPENHNGDNIYGQDDKIYVNQTPLLTLNPSFNGNGGLEFAFPAPPPLSGYNGGSDIALFANNSTGGPGDYGSLESANLGGYANVTSGGTFTLISIGTHSVPDGGATLALLGLAVAGLAGLRRKLSI
jgi:VPDSG-CTERM motif